MLSKTSPPKVLLCRYYYTTKGSMAETPQYGIVETIVVGANFPRTQLPITTLQCAIHIRTTYIEVYRKDTFSTMN